MESTLISAILVGFFVSLFLNFILFIKLQKSKDEILLLKQENDAIKKSQKEVLTIEAQQILHDLTTQGEAIIRITPLNPTDVFWRSPR